jgi:hypothetical protein
MGIDTTGQSENKPQGFSSKLGFVAGELGSSFLKAGGTTLRIGGGVLAGAATTLVFGLVSGMAFNGPNVVGTTIAQTAAIAMSGPFVHHVFKSKLAENINPIGAFARATKATSYALAGIFAPLTLLGIGAPSAAPEDFTPPSEFEQNFTPSTRPLGGRYNIA